MNLENYFSRLKSHESPRFMGRNSKGTNASARLRQLKKQRNTNRKSLNT